MQLTDIPKNTASWQSLFWASLAIHLSDLLQETRAVCGHYHRSLLCRSSPSVTAVDTISCLFEFIWILSCHSCQTRLVRPIRWCWYRRRLRHPFHVETEHAGLRSRCSATSPKGFHHTRSAVDTSISLLSFLYPFRVPRLRPRSFLSTAMDQFFSFK